MSMSIRQAPLAAGSVKLIPLDMSHAEALFEAGAEAVIWNHMPFRAATLDHMRRIVRQAIEDGERGHRLTYTVTQLDSVMGSTSILNPSAEHRSFEIGFSWLTPSSWGTGLNQTCKYLLLHHGFEDAGAIRIQFRTTAGNIRSQQALKKIGAVCEGTLRKSFQGADMMFFSIIGDEWPAVKEKLEPFAVKTGGGC